LSASTKRSALLTHCRAALGGSAAPLTAGEAEGARNLAFDEGDFSLRGRSLTGERDPNGSVLLP